MTTEDDILRERDPLYLIPNSYKSKTRSDYPPWMLADVREKDHKMWLHKYKFFSHPLANKREKLPCQFYGSMSKQETYEIGKEAKNTKVAEIWPELDAKKYAYDATMSRIIDAVNSSNVKPQSLTQPMWDKYKYHSNMRPHLDADNHKQAQDPLHHFMKVGAPTKSTIPQHDPTRFVKTLDMPPSPKKGMPSATKQHREHRSMGKSRSAAAVIDRAR